MPSAVAAPVPKRLSAIRTEVDAGTESCLLPELLNLILEYLRGIPLVFDPSVMFGGGVFEYLGTRAYTRPGSTPALPSFGVRTDGTELTTLPARGPPLVSMVSSRPFIGCVERCIGRHFGNRHVRQPP